MQLGETSLFGETIIIFIIAILLVVGLCLNDSFNKSLRLGLSIGGLVVLCVAILTFYTFEYIRRRANAYYTKAFSIANVLDKLAIKNLSHTQSININNNKDLITKYLSCQIMESYMTKEMDFANVSIFSFIVPKQKKKGTKRCPSFL